MLEQAEALAAAAWGADMCRFSHNGSTHPNQALCLAATRPGEPVLVHRTCHKSVYSGLILAGARPVWLSPDVSDELGIPLGTPVARVSAALDAEPAIRTAILTEPSYVGVLSDLPAIAAACHERGVALICDHAWAAHFGFAQHRAEERARARRRRDRAQHPQDAHVAHARRAAARTRHAAASTSSGSGRPSTCC